MGLSQVIDVCEMYRKITAKTNKHPIMYYSLITGIYDEWLHKEVAAQGIAINPDILYQAGMVIAKKVYEDNKGKVTARKDWIALLVKEVGLTEAGASTYYANLKNGKY